MIVAAFRSRLVRDGPTGSVPLLTAVGLRDLGVQPTERRRVVTIDSSSAA